MAKHEERTAKRRARRPRVVRQSDYERLSEFRYLIRQFLRFSQEKAGMSRLTPRQHQALLALKGFPDGKPVSIGALAERLAIRHSSAVELADRLGKAKLVVRERDSSDRRRVLLRLTRRAERRLADLSAAHLDELDRIQPTLLRLLRTRRPDR